jgi:hypothetical protein
MSSISIEEEAARSESQPKARAKIPARIMNRDCLVYLVHALVGCRAVLKSQSEIP